MAVKKLSIGGKRTKRVITITPGGNYDREESNSTKKESGSKKSKRTKKASKG